MSRRDFYAQQTRQALVDAATACFLERGYVGSSLNEIGRRAQVTRGAVYHHFDGKLALFEEIFTRLQEGNVQALVAASGGPDTPMEQAQRTLSAFLRLCAAEPFRSIVMEQGPVALGWRRWRELDQRYTLSILEAHLHGLAAAGVLGVPISQVLIQVLYSALHEAAELVANAVPEDREDLHAEAVGVLIRILSGLSVDHQVVRPPDRTEVR